MNPTGKEVCFSAAPRHANNSRRGFGFSSAAGACAAVLALWSGAFAATPDLPEGSYVICSPGRLSTGADKAEQPCPFPLAENQYLLSGGPDPADAIFADDDFDVAVGGAAVFRDDDHCRTDEVRPAYHRSYDGTPLILTILPGESLRIRGIDTGPSDAAIGPLYLRGRDGAIRRICDLVQKRSLPALPSTFFEVEVRSDIVSGLAGRNSENREPTRAFQDSSEGVQNGWEMLFPENGVPKDWSVRAWDDVASAPPTSAVWEAKDGVLHGSSPRGTWLVSDRLYGDFLLEFEFRLGAQGNSGCGLRFPGHGDPAFEGMELQMVDPRYYGATGAGPDQLTGSLYQGSAPLESRFRAMDWNRYRILCVGPRVRVWLNGGLIQDLNLAERTTQLERGEPLSDRPRRGHLGFQELSRGGTQVQIRKARIIDLDPGS